MIEHGLAHTAVATYLRSTRGPGAEYLRYPTDRHIRFWGDFLESLEISGISTSHIKLSVVDSYRAEIETLKIAERSHLILDQAILDVFSLMTSVELRMSGPALGSAETDGVRPHWWEHALFANRFLADGRRMEALIQGNLCAHAKESQPELIVDEARRDRWVDIQVAFSIAHEVGHCFVFGGDQVLARSGAQSFEEFTRPYVEHMDQEAPVSYVPNPAGASMERVLHHFVRTANAELAERGEEPLDFEGLPAYRGWSFGEKLDLIMSPDSDIGEEVVSDYLAMSMVARLQSTSTMPFDECLAACVSAIRITFLLRMVELVANSYFDSRLPTTALAELINEMQIRQEFAGISAMVLSRRQHLREIQETEEELSEAVQAALERRSDRLAKHLNTTQEIWQEQVFLSTLLRRHAGATYELVTEVEDDAKFVGAANSPGLERLLARITGIGAP